MQWKFFADEKPETDELLLVSYHDTGGEDGLFEPADKKLDWFHIETMMLSQEAFGHALYRGPSMGNRLSETEHKQVNATGRWVYAHAIAAANIGTERFLPDSTGIIVNQSRRGLLFP